MALPARIIITRPVLQAAQWVDALNAQGLSASSFPLIEIADALSPAQRAQLQQRAAQADVCMWVSANAVSYFWKKNGQFSDVDIEKLAINNIVTNTSLRHWATGPGTVAELQNCGVPVSQIDAPDLHTGQWDSEALWLRVKGQIQPGTQVLILRGLDVGTPIASRDWLAQQVRTAGGVVEFAAVYERRAPQFGAEQMAWAQVAAQDGSVWVLSSSQALTHLPPLPETGDGWSRACCVVTHERIAQAARAKGFAVVCMSRPAILDVAQSIKSIL
jgi:uroporphyrinogen-III synthase